MATSTSPLISVCERSGVAGAVSSHYGVNFMRVISRI
jgi:hypothetical protein